MKNNKKRNKSFNSDNNKIKYGEEKNKDKNTFYNYFNYNNINDENQRALYKYIGENKNKLNYENVYIPERNDFRIFKNNNVNTSYNFTNYYLNEIEVLKLNDKYQFNDSSFQ